MFPRWRVSEEREHCDNKRAAHAEQDDGTATEDHCDYSKVRAIESVMEWFAYLIVEDESY